MTRRGTMTTRTRNLTFISNRLSRFWSKCALLVVAVATGTSAQAGSLLILTESVTGGLGSKEALYIASIPHTPVLCDLTCWNAKNTAADFNIYAAIVVGDPTCTFTAPIFDANTTAAMAAAVTGNVSIWGTDPTFHFTQGGDKVIKAGIDFALSGSGTGAYITTSCYYDSAAANTPVPMLDAFGAFTAQGAQCWNDSLIVATSSALTGLTNTDVSNWSCSAHNFFNSFPTNFIPLVIAEGVPGGAFTTTDGAHTGGVYVLARGARPLFAPAVSEWGLGALALLLLTGVAFKFSRRRVTA